MNEFLTEKSSKNHFLNSRIAKGVICHKCECKEHYWLQNNEQFKYKNYHFRSTLKKGTILHTPKIHYIYLYLTKCLMTSTNKTF